MKAATKQAELAATLAAAVEAGKADYDRVYAAVFEKEVDSVIGDEFRAAMDFAMAWGCRGRAETLMLKLEPASNRYWLTAADGNGAFLSDDDVYARSSPTGRIKGQPECIQARSL